MLRFDDLIVSPLAASAHPSRAILLACSAGAALPPGRLRTARAERPGARTPWRPAVVREGYPASRMCGRFTLTTREVHDLARALSATFADEDSARLHRPRWNIALMNDHWLPPPDAGRRALVRARFGLDGPGGRLVINARAETAAKLPTFRDAFERGRCVVPADGFYEWQGGRGQRSPMWFHPPDGGLLLLPG